MNHRYCVAVVMSALLLGGLASASEDLYGFWEWDHTYGGIAGQTMTPATEGMTKQLELRDDGTAYLYYDEVWQDSGTWNVDSGLNIDLDDFWMAGATFDFDPLPEPDALSLFAPCCDLYNHFFDARAPVPVVVDDRTFGAIKRLYR